jgi:glucosyl-3-phosphoglycerate synthase
VSDFAQHGLISTFQQLRDAGGDGFESELGCCGRNIALILPCHAAELGSPALEGLIRELAPADFLTEIVISMNGLDAAGFESAHTIFAPLPQPHRIVWNDGPRLEKIYLGAGIRAGGKGRNVWAALGLLIREARAEIIAVQDCDVTTFRRGTLARLCYAVASPELGYSFAKMYYSRVAGRIYGRASRLFLSPFLQALIRIGGHHPLLDFLLSFRYPLAGECAFTRSLAGEIRISPGWDLEAGLLCEVFRHAPGRDVCQVDGGSDYDHKHQPLNDGRGGGLVPMIQCIARTLLRELMNEGFAAGPGFLEALGQLYRREAAEAIRRSKHLAMMNRLPFDEAGETAALVTFAAGLDAATLPSIESDAPLAPWERLIRTDGDFIRGFREAIDLDNQSPVTVSSGRPMPDRTARGRNNELIY